MSEGKKVLVTGASGLVGRPLCAALQKRGHTVITLSRGSNGDFQWDPEVGTLNMEALEGVDAVIHLAGESVAQRWNDAVKMRILNSRVKSTKLLAQRIIESGERPSFIAASGINYYGYDRDDPIDETAFSGEGFLAEVCRRWEGAAKVLENAGCRCVLVRTGLVLSRKGGALAKMLPPFKAGVAGRIGSGKQGMSWIALDDLVAVYIQTVEDKRYRGPINAVAPQPVSNRSFTETLAKLLHRPALFPIPRFAIRLLFGEMGSETVLSNLFIQPKALQSLGFKWQLPELKAALENTLEK